MLELYQYTPVWEDVPNASPFCMKLETYLKLAKLPYKVIHQDNPRKAPKGKLPYIKDGDYVLADSGFIIEYIKKKYGDPLDGWLDEEQAAVMHAYRRMIEEHLSLVLIYSRWADEAGWQVVRKDFFKTVPPPLKMILPLVLRKHMMKWMHGHGVLRHTRAEIYDLGRDDLVSIATFLGQKKFLMGDKPTSVDASLYSFLANILRSPVPSPLRDLAEQQGNLKPYLERLDRYMKNLS